MSDFKYPTENIELPSKGKLYPSTSPLSKGFVEMRYLSAKDEDILTNVNYIQQDIVVDKLFEALIVTPGVQLNELLAGDADALLYAARILSYGTEYQFTALHPIKKTEAIVTIDLNEVTHLPLAPEIENAQINEFEFVLPRAKIPVTFKLLTRKDRDKIKTEQKSWAKLFPDQSYGRTLFLMHSIIAVDGNRDKTKIKDFVEKGIMTALDASKLREYIHSISPGLNSKVENVYDDGYSVEAEVSLTSTFLWPDSL